ncbi:hypothetical protein TWF788_009527 [Orbilia oligospora]|uniref:CBM1 domain-containing protein n=1 Tax=Orbilia oligospora TaxID=2813651 RepID=A0A7C8KF88_ORBOL|nr:hypothetical protein TWF788_009527 [Orbilia oligospora]
MRVCFRARSINPSCGRVDPIPRACNSTSSCKGTVEPRECLGPMAYSVGTLAPKAGSGQGNIPDFCGGIGWTGPTTCVSETYCYAWNPYYSQCLEGTGSSTTTTSTTTTARSTTLVTSTATRTSSSLTRSSTTTTRPTTTTTPRSSTTTTRSSTTTSPTTTSRVPTTSAVCGTATFTPISASAAIAALHPGWNIGNTLDAVPNEGSWNNPPITGTVIDAIKASGYKSIRIPVTWTHHFSGSSPTWTVDPVWMNRVEEVVDMVLSKGLYAILNVHHDSWDWFDYTKNGNAPVEEKFGALWAQIGDRFKCKGERLLFEPINEPPGSTAEDGAELNKLNDIFLTKINQAGGFNPQRVVTLCGLYMDSYKTISYFKRGSLYPNQPWGLQFHYYSPYDFVFRAWGKSTWGSADEKAALENDFKYFRGNFSDIPVVIGEFGGSPATLEPAAGWRYLDFLVQTANKYKFSIVTWDNGEDLFNRTSLTWYDPAGQSILINAANGASNALAVSTLDGSVPQLSSAFIFHKVGTPVTTQTATYENVGSKTLVSIKNKAGTALTSSQYSFSGSVLTLPDTYLSTLYTANSAPSVKDVLTLTFSSGAFLTLTIVHWDVPVIAETTLTAPTYDYRIPITWNGYNRVAAVRAVWDNGVYVSDDWTVWLPQLQQARWTFGNWGYEANNIALWLSGSDYLRNNKPAGVNSAILTWEFFPRDGYAAGSNAVNLTITF